MTTPRSSILYFTGACFGLLFCLSSPHVIRAEDAAVKLDEITTKDGSVIRGTVKDMTEASLKIETPFGGEVNIAWPDVEKITTNSPLPFVLSDGTVIRGLASPDILGQLRVKAEELSEPAIIKMQSVSAINPPKKKDITYRGNVNAGFVANDGNTRTKSGSFLAAFVARSERQRVTLRGAYNYAEDRGDLTARNGRGSFKYDLFVTKRFYLFASTLFEYDRFQDLNLRTALSGGPGYQLLEKGDLKNEYLKGIESYIEAGIAYFDEDRRVAEDDSYAAARWAFKLDWDLLPDKISLFHYHEGYPGLENAKDLYISTEQGVRFHIFENFISTFQVNWDWDNSPSPGLGRSDTQYLWMLGYLFDL